MRFLWRLMFFMLSVFFLTNVLASEASTNLNPYQTITVSPTNPTFTFSLPANATTGYSWTIKNYDENLLRLQDAHYEKSQEKTVGRSGVMTWQFEVLPQVFQKEIETTPIVLVYARPWAPKDNPKQTTIMVQFKAKD